jgi:cell wall-associated NlpC family hydrolase
MRRRALPFLAAAGLLTGCATQTSASSSSSTTAARAATTTTTAAAAVTVPRSHPQAIEPVAGAGSPVEATPATTTPSTVSVDSGAGSGAGSALAKPVSDAQIRQELSASGLTASANQATLTPDGLAIAPIDAPAAVQQVIAAGNEIAHLPYVWGGGHATYEDTGYDCSGSISFVFGAAHLLRGPVVSGTLMSYGDPGPGKWITIFANAGHTFMYIAGLRFDTVALAETGTRWSSRPANEPDLRSFSVRHPPGL